MNVEPRLMTRARATNARQAIEQSLLDWRHEVASAKTTSGRLAAHLRSSVGVLRVVGAASVQQGADAVTSGWAVWLMAWVLFPIGLNHYTLSSHDAHGYASAALADYGILMQMTPIFAFLALATGRRRSIAPALGLIAVLAVVYVIVGRLGWPVVWTFMVRDNEAWWTQTFRGHAPGVMAWAWIVYAIWASVAMVLLGDRVRRDRFRMALMLGLVCVFTGGELVSSAIRSQVALWGVTSIDGATPAWYSVWQFWGRWIQTPVGFPHPTFALLLWGLLVYRQRGASAVAA